MPTPAEYDAPLAKALEEATTTLRSRLQDDQSWGDLAMLCHAHGLHEEARRAYRVAQALDPADSLWPHLLGLVCEALSLPDQAIEALETSRKMEEFDVVARCVLGRLYQGRGDFAMAKTLFLEAVKIDSKSIAARLGLGQLALRSGVLDPALRNLKLVLEEYPRCGPAHAALAEVYAKQKDTEKAAFHRRWSLASGSRVPLPDQYMQKIETLGVTHVARLKRGNEAAAQRAWDEAIVHYQAAVALRPELSEAGRLLGLALVKKGRRDEGLIELRRVTKLDGGREAAWVAIARTQLAAGARAEALAAVQEALAVETPSGAAHVLEGDIYRAERKSDEALAAYDRALALVPDDAVAIVAKADFLLTLRAPRQTAQEDAAVRQRERERAQRAITLAARALELQGDLQRGYATAGRAHMQLWEFSESADEKMAQIDAAVNHFRALTTYFAHEKRGHVALIRALHAGGRRKEMLEAIRAAQQRWPEDPQFLRRKRNQG
jgi:tetratricopeptide (TPR) repeat protein